MINYKLTFCFLAFAFLSTCHSKPNTTNNSPQTITDTTPIKQGIENKGNPIDYDNTKIIKDVYVLNRSGVEAKQECDKQSETVTKYSYAEKLEVIEIKDGWLGIRDRVTRKYIKNGINNEVSGWEKIYVPTGDTGELDSIKLVQDDLNVIIEEVKDKNNRYVEQISSLKKYIRLELISKAQFDSKKPTAINYFVEDTTSILKKNGVITLPCGNKVKKYVDKPNDEADAEVYRFVGQIPAINKYVLAGQYYESGDYKLIDKITGNETAITGLPNLSNDKKYIAGLDIAGYDDGGFLELYNVANMKLIVAATFKNWMPADDKQTFWGDDGYLYAAVLYIAIFNSQDSSSAPLQYLRIKVL